jgi:hypothetical protein
MRHTLLALVAVLALSTTASSQAVSGVYPSPPWCPTCYVASASDAPGAGSTVDGTEVFWLWGGVCASGAWPDTVSAVATVGGTIVSVPVLFVYGGPRADVTAHLTATGCHGGHSVVAAWLPAGVPTGTTALAVRLHSSSMYAFHTYQVTP